MATVVGTVYLNGCNYQLAYDLLSQNIANNTSNVRLYGILNVTNNYVSWSRGTASVHTESAGIGTYYSRGSHVLIQRDFTWGHDNSGNFNTYIGASLSTTFVSGDCGGNISLPQIPRQANITGASNFNDEENPSFTFNNPGGFTMNVWLEPNPAGDHLCVRNNIPNNGRYTWNLTEEERNQLRAKCKSNSCTVRMGLYTIIGNTTYTSYVDKTMTIVNANPTFTDFDYKDSNSQVVAVTENNQVLVKGLSNLVVDIKAENKMVAIKQATAKNYVSMIDNISISTEYSENDLSIDLGSINSSGTKKLDVRAYDSRNNSTLVSKNVIVYDYEKPVINATISRLNNFEDETTLRVDGSYSKLIINEVNKNGIQLVKYRYRETDGDWSNWENMSIDVNDNKFICETVIMLLDNTKSFEFEIEADDNLSNNKTILYVDVGKPVFFVSSNKRACYINGQEILTYDVVDEW